MNIYAIDPGPEQSAFVWLWNGEPHDSGKIENRFICDFLRNCTLPPETVLVIEQIACMGMAVGSEVFESVFWSGRFAQQWEHRGRKWDRIKRHQVKMHLCNSMKAKDGNIRQALIDRFGKPGTKKNPGKTYGLSGDMWQALAVAVTYADLTPTIAAK